MHDVFLKWHRVVVAVGWHLVSRGLVPAAVVVPFSLVNPGPAARTCCGHTTKPDLSLLQSVAEIQRRVFDGESGCRGVQ